MAWDPTDYKDMLDDDWNDIHRDILIDTDKYWPATDVLGGKFLIALRRNEPSLYASIMNRLDYLKQINASKREVAKDIMKNFYLIPIARKREAIKLKGNKVDESLTEFLNNKKINE